MPRCTETQHIELAISPLAGRRECLLHVGTARRIVRCWLPSHRRNKMPISRSAAIIVTSQLHSKRASLTKQSFFSIAYRQIDLVAYRSGLSSKVSSWRQSTGQWYRRRRRSISKLRRAPPVRGRRRTWMLHVKRIRYLPPSQCLQVMATKSIGDKLLDQSVKAIEDLSSLQVQNK